MTRKGPSKRESHADSQRPAAPQFGVEVQGIKPVILVADVQNPDGEFRSSLGEPPSNQSIEMPELVPGQVRRIPAVVLARPKRVCASEQSPGMIEEQPKIHLMESRFLRHFRSAAYGGRNLRKAALPLCVAEAVAHTDRPLLAQELVDVRVKTSLPILKLLRRAGRNNLKRECRGQIKCADRSVNV